MHQKIQSWSSVCGVLILHRLFKKKSSLCWAYIALSVVCSSPICAQLPPQPESIVYTWNGAGNDGLWNNPANWRDHLVPKTQGSLSETSSPLITRVDIIPKSSTTQLTLSDAKLSLDQLQFNIPNMPERNLQYIFNITNNTELTLDHALVPSTDPVLLLQTKETYSPEMSQFVFNIDDSTVTIQGRVRGNMNRPLLRIINRHGSTFNLSDKDHSESADPYNAMDIDNSEGSSVNIGKNTGPSHFYNVNGMYTGHGGSHLHILGGTIKFNMRGGLNGDILTIDPESTFELSPSFQLNGPVRIDGTLKILNGISIDELVYGGGGIELTERSVLTIRSEPESMDKRFTGVISGPGTLIKNNVDVSIPTHLTLVSKNTYTGGTEICSGTLILKGDGTPGAIGEKGGFKLLNLGILDVSASDYSGSIPLELYGKSWRSENLQSGDFILGHKKLRVVDMSRLDATYDRRDSVILSGILYGEPDSEFSMNIGSEQNLILKGSNPFAGTVKLRSGNLRVGDQLGAGIANARAIELDADATRQSTKQLTLTFAPVAEDVIRYMHPITEIPGTTGHLTVDGNSKGTIVLNSDTLSISGNLKVSRSTLKIEGDQAASLSSINTIEISQDGTLDLSSIKNPILNLKKILMSDLSNNKLLLGSHTLNITGQGAWEKSLKPIKEIGNNSSLIMELASKNVRASLLINLSTDQSEQSVLEFGIPLESKGNVNALISGTESSTPQFTGHVILKNQANIFFLTNPQILSNQNKSSDSNINMDCSMRDLIFSADENQNARFYFMALPTKKISNDTITYNHPILKTTSGNAQIRFINTADAIAYAPETTRTLELILGSPDSTFSGEVVLPNQVTLTLKDAGTIGEHAQITFDTRASTQEQFKPILNLAQANHAVTVGSLSGPGMVHLGSNNLILNPTEHTTMNFSGQIQGDARVGFMGADNTVILTEDQTYTDLTEIGPHTTLILKGERARFSRSSGFVVNGVLDLSQTQNATGIAPSFSFKNLYGTGSIKGNASPLLLENVKFSGHIQGPEDVHIVGDVVLRGPSSYTGMTLIRTKGNLILTDGFVNSFKSSGIVNGGRLTVCPEEHTTWSYNGRITQDPAIPEMSYFFHSGLGTSVLNHTTEQNTVVVEQGSLLIGDAFHSTAKLNAQTIRIEPNGLLGGHGRVVGSVVNAGTLAPGFADEQSTFAIEGDYTQTATGTVLVTLGQKGAGTLVVAGAATLEGQLKLQLAENIQNTQENYTIIHAKQLTGVFNNMSSGTFSQGLLSGTISYVPDGLRIKLNTASTKIIASEETLELNADDVHKNIFTSQEIDNRGILALKPKAGTTLQYDGNITNGTPRMDASANVQHSGLGTSILNGSRIEQAHVLVSQGSLLIGDASHTTATLNAQTIRVEPNGLLGGHGRVVGSVVNAGTLAPGFANEQSTFAIEGDYTQTATGTVLVTLGQKGAGTLVVAGAVTLEGQLKLQWSDGVTPSQNTAGYSLVHAQQLKGKFNNVLDNGTFTQGLLTGVITHSFNQKENYQEVVLKPKAQSQNLYDRDFLIEHSKTDGQKGLVQHLLKDSGTSTKILEAFGALPRNERATRDLLNQLGASSCADQLFVLAQHSNTYTRLLSSKNTMETKGGLWMELANTDAELKDPAQETQLKTNAQWFGLGYVFPVSHQTALGLSVATQRVQGASTVFENSHWHGQLFQLGLNGWHHQGPWTLSGVLTVGTSDHITANRIIQSDVVSAQYKVKDGAAQLQIDYSAPHGFKPFIGFSHHTISRDAYQDTTQTAYALTIQDSSYHSNRSQLGVTYHAPLSKVQWISSIAWEHEFSDTQVHVQSGLLKNIDPFSILGTKTGREFLLVHTGFSVPVTQNMQAGIVYDGNWSTHWKDSIIGLSLNIKF